tara:strand:+ start:7381 stop:7488 length:108 start_codon:yes stop_codon:yes gene_type:complete
MGKGKGNTQREREGKEGMGKAYRSTERGVGRGKGT